MIDDPDLRLMFKAECEERLQRLEQDLLQLEQQPDLKHCLEEVAREIHSVKGAARMLNVKDMEAFSHQFEAVFKTATKDNQLLTTEVIERLYAAVDVLRQLSEIAVNGSGAVIDLDQALAQLNKEPETPDPAQTENTTISPPPSVISAPPLSKEEDKAKKGAEAVALNQPTAVVTEPKIVEAKVEKKSSLLPEIKSSETLTTISNASDEYKIETIRVPTQKLDNLLTHSGELAVSKNRLEQRLNDADTLLFLWEQWKNQQDSTLKEKYFKEFESSLQVLRNNIYEDNTRFSYLSNEIETGIRSIRLLPLATVFNLFPRMVRDIAKQEQKQINFVISGEDTVADKRIIEEIKDPLNHLIRNAIHHAIEKPHKREKLNKPPQGRICLRAYQTLTNIVIEVEDDGHGIDCERIKSFAVQNKLYRQEEVDAMSESQLHFLIFEHGFSTADTVTSISGRGVGMPIVRTNIAALKGRIEIGSTLHKGTLIRLRLPMTVTTTQVLVVRLQNRFYGLPLEAVESILRVNKQQIFNVDGHNTIVHQDKAVSIAHLADLLNMGKPNQQQEWMCVIVTLEHQQRLAILVDELISEQEVLLKPIGNFLDKTRNISGVTILGDGSVCIILNPDDLVQNTYKDQAIAITDYGEEESTSAGVILYAEDSITTRTQVKRILEKEGFEVVAAVDGFDAYQKSANRHFDGIVSDVNMPNMDGLELTEKIRADSRYQDVPIILISAQDKDDDRRKGLELGASAYLSKNAFDQTTLIETLKRLI
jgi:two-component system chemotaxis sensor kinase CheA